MDSVAQIAQRYLARKVIDPQGVTHGLSLVEISPCHSRYTITPFTRETPNTQYVDGTLRVIHTPGIGFSVIEQ